MKNLQIVLITVVTFLLSSCYCFKCGQRKVKIRKSIDQSTSPGDWPWQVAVYHRIGSRDTFACGATLISESFVLVGDRCVKGEGRQISVRMGVFDLKELDPNSFQQHGVRRVHRIGGEVALLELDDQVEFTNYVQPACLNLEEDLTEHFGSAVGWGIDESELKSSRLSVISGEDCLKSNSFCARFSNESTVCNGDKSAWVHFKRKGVWFVGGIIPICSTKDYAAIINVQHYAQWIQNVTKLQYAAESSDSISCTTPTNKPGMCVRIEHCKNIYDIINSTTPTTKYNYYIKQAACTLPGVPRSICCQTSEIDSRVVTAVVSTPETLPRDCGRYLANRISGGSNANLMEFPWMARLVWRNRKTGKLFVFCQGSLISKRHVLTSAWCVNDDSSILEQVGLGEYDRDRNPDCNVNDPNDCAPPVRYYDVESFVGHPDLDDDRAKNDIALIRLSSDVTFEDHIQPICLPDSLKPNNLDQYIVSGWGSTVKSGDWIAVLQKGTIPAVTYSECQEAFGANAEYHIGPGVLCAGRNGSSNVCTDDNGSPLGYPIRNNGSVQFVHYGIASVFSCGVQFPSIYTDVSFFMDWILANMEL